LPLKIAHEALIQNLKVNLCDPFVNKNDIKKEITSKNFNYFTNPYESARSSNVIICITPWPKLKKLKFKKIANLMSRPKIFFDARNYFAKEKNIIEKAGIKYIGVGQ
jgi:UDP-glucose 6-dehydrogenase